MDDQDEASCGRGLAASAVVPSALAAVAAGIAQNLDVHARALDPGDLAAVQEKDVYARVVHHLRRAVDDLRTAADDMAAAVDLLGQPEGGAGGGDRDGPVGVEAEEVRRAACW